MKFSDISIFILLSSASAMAGSQQSIEQNQPIVIAQTSQTPIKPDRTIGVCQLVNSTGAKSGSDPRSPIYAVSPVPTVSDYINMHEKRHSGLEGKATLLQKPEHGVLKEEWNQNYRYLPVADYLGNDSATFMVEIGDLNVKAVYYFKVIDGGAIGGTEDQDKKNCPKGMYWKISLKPMATESVIWS